MHLRSKHIPAGYRMRMLHEWLEQKTHAGPTDHKLFIIFKKNNKKLLHTQQSELGKENTCFTHSSFVVSNIASCVSCTTRKCIWSWWNCTRVSDCAVGVLPVGICKNLFFCFSHPSEPHTQSCWKSKKIGQPSSQLRLWLQHESSKWEPK